MSPTPPAPPVSSLAVFCNDDAVILAVCQNGKVRLISADRALSSYAEGSPLESGTKFDSAAFVKGASVPSLVLTSGNKLFLRAAAAEKRGSEVFGVTVSAMATDL